MFTVPWSVWLSSLTEPENFVFIYKLSAGVSVSVFNFWLWPPDPASANSIKRRWIWETMNVAEHIVLIVKHTHVLSCYISASINFHIAWSGRYSHAVSFLHFQPSGDVEFNNTYFKCRVEKVNLLIEHTGIKLTTNTIKIYYKINFWQMSVCNLIVWDVIQYSGVLFCGMPYHYPDWYSLLLVEVLGLFNEKRQ